MLRAAARRCGIWEKPPLLRDINGKVLDGFIKKVTKALPQLEGHDHEIRGRLSESLIYRRNQLNNTKYWKRVKEIKKYQDDACQRPVPKQDPGHVQVPVHTTLTVVQSSLEVDQEETGFTFFPSEELFVMEGAKKLARATFLRRSKGDGDYIKLVLQSSYLNGDDERIPLSGPNKEKHFQDIKVGEKFYWRNNQVLSKKKIPHPAETSTKQKKAKTLAKRSAACLPDFDIDDHDQALTDTSTVVAETSTNHPDPPQIQPTCQSTASTSTKKKTKRAKTSHPHNLEKQPFSSSNPAPSQDTCSLLETPPAPFKKYKGYVYVAIEDPLPLNETPPSSCVINNGGKPQRQRRPPKKCLEYIYD